MDVNKIRVFALALATSFFMGFVVGTLFAVLIPNLITGMIFAVFIFLLSIFAIFSLILVIIYSSKFLELFK